MSEFRDICKNRLIYQEWLSPEFAKKGIHWIKKRMSEHHFSTFIIAEFYLQHNWSEIIDICFY